MISLLASFSFFLFLSLSLALILFHLSLFVDHRWKLSALSRRAHDDDGNFLDSLTAKKVCDLMPPRFVIFLQVGSLRIALVSDSIMMEMEIDGINMISVMIQ